MKEAKKWGSIKLYLVVFKEKRGKLFCISGDTILIPAATVPISLDDDG